jgi:hypothetical protein
MTRLTEVAGAATLRPWEQGAAKPQMVGHALHDSLNAWRTVADCRYKNGKADAAFIVLAVNHIEELVAALTALVEDAEDQDVGTNRIEDDGSGSPRPWKGWLNGAGIVEQARAALDKLR